MAQVARSILLGIIPYLAVACTAHAITAHVVNVYDGDTLTVVLDGARERVRLIGIDAPEVKSNSHGPAGELGPAAGLYLTALVGGRTVELVLGIKERDRYGRLLAYVYLDGVFINLEMVRAGYAVVYTVAPDVAHAAEYLAAEREARAEGRGLWVN